MSLLSCLLAARTLLRVEKGCGPGKSELRLWKANLAIMLFVSVMLTKMIMTLKLIMKIMLMMMAMMLTSRCGRRSCLLKRETASLRELHTW